MENHHFYGYINYKWLVNHSNPLLSPLQDMPSLRFPGLLACAGNCASVLEGHAWVQQGGGRITLGEVVVDLKSGDKSP